MTKHRIRPIAAALGLGSLVLATASPLAATAAAPAPEAAESAIKVRIQEAMAGLDHPWDVAFTPDGTMLVTERDSERLMAKLPDGEERVLFEAPEGIWHSGETGLMGLEVDPKFNKNHYIYTCHGSDSGADLDVRVVKWEIDEDFTAATKVKAIVTGMPVSSGRHGGCRLRFDPDGALYIGTGDAAIGTNPQDLTSLGGKVLRVKPGNGKAWPGNPFEDSADPNTQLIWTYGHRNVQGLAWRTENDNNNVVGMWSVEHGPDKDDEVNQLKDPGGNSGWNPVPGYNESVPMTDLSLDDVFEARWSSGVPTLATSGATWLTHKQWGNWDGRLAVASLKDTSLQLMKFTALGKLMMVEDIPDLNDTFGRLRTAQTGPGGALYITTDNGGGADVVLKVTVR